MNDPSTFERTLSDTFSAAVTDPVFWRPTRLDVPSAWHGHTPFAFWLISQTSPRLLVELGTHHGASYAAFCEAVRRCELPTRCFAVDTWQGDQHLGQYGPEDLAELRAFHDPLYGSFSSLLVMDFAAALDQFSDGSIDLLHIDGQHDYVSVRRDFDSWQCKLSDRAVVLFHDTNVREREFGVWRLWRELRATHPGFEFLHGSGLGVLAVGPDAPAAVAALARIDDVDTIRRVRDRFATIGAHWECEAELRFERTRLAVLERDNGELRRQLSAAVTQAAEDPLVQSAAAMRITAVIPLYNGARFIAEALRSVLTQTRKVDEILVVDDGSTDAGPDLVRDMAADQPITLLRKPNGGQSSARNFGIAHASGTHIALLDQDDVWYPDHLEILARPFLEPATRPLGWSYGNLDEMDEAGQLTIRRCLRLSPSPHPKRDVDDCLRHDMFVLPSASLFTRTAFDAVNGFDETLSGYEDDDLFLRMFRAGFGCYYTDEAVTRWRVFMHSASFSPRMAKSRMAYFHKLMGRFPDVPRLQRFYTRDLLAPRFLPMLVHEYTNALRERRLADASIAAEDLLFVASRHRLKVRLLLGGLGPLMRHPDLARRLIPVVDSLRPVLRRALR